MILRIPENRKVIIEYLKNINEDNFMEEIVIPLFTSNGYYVYRINTHGPGEHGKDIIFFRYNPLFFENDYIAVQAKAEILKISNVEEFASQIKRAMKIRFPSKSGQGDLLPGGVIFINARKHTNEANVEFPQLIGEYFQFVRILSQENVCDLILNSGIGPKTLIDKLALADTEIINVDDRLVYDVLMWGNPAEIDKLFDHQLRLIRSNISHKVKKMVIETINLRWQQDRSWEGTFKPMKWFDDYFDFFDPRQYSYLQDILEEYTSLSPSFKAEPHTRSIVNKIKPEMLATQAKWFIYFCGRLSLGGGSENRVVVIKKLEELYNSDLVSSPDLKQLMEKILKFRELRRGDNDFGKLGDEIEQIVYPEFYENRKEVGAMRDDKS